MPGESAEHFLRKYGERPGQAFGPLALRSRAPCWPTAPAEAGPQGFGASRDGVFRASRLPSKLDVEVHLLRAANDLEVDVVARLLRSDEINESLDRRNGPTVDLDDHVAAGRPALALDRDLIRRRLEASLCSTTAGPHGGDEHAARHGQVEEAPDVRLQRLPFAPEERMLDRAALDQFGDDVPDGVDRGREPDADVALALTAGLDLGVDPDHLALRVQQRAARVAVVQRGVGLDHVRDRELIRRLDPALDGADDSCSDGAVEAERVPDCDHLVADPHKVGVAERQGLERARLDLDLQHRDIGGRIDADHLRLEALVVRKADLDRALPADHVVIRHDVAGLVDDEARAERTLRLAAAEGIAEEVGRLLDA